MTFLYHYNLRVPKFGRSQPESSFIYELKYIIITSLRDRMLELVLVTNANHSKKE